MSNLTLSEQLLLGILAEKDYHGYDIEKVIKERGMRQWTGIGFSSIYYLLNRLEQNEFVTATKIKDAQQGRKLYAITAKGIAACTQATRLTLLDEYSQEPLLIGLANSPMLNNGDLVNILKRRREITKQRIREITKTRQLQGQLPAFVGAIFDYSLRKLEAEAAWAATTIKNLKEEMMEKIDFKKELAALYNPKNTEFELVEVPRMNFLMVDGKGDPNTAKDYGDAVEALYSVAYALKFMSKKVLGKDYGVAPLEGLWTADDLSAFTNAQKDKYQWTMMIMQPEWITEEMVTEAIEATKARKQLPALPKVRFEAYAEGKSLQLLHVGSYDDEAPKLKYLHTEYMPANKLSFNGRHHEIYLSDPRKTAANKLKTILRQPVR